MDGLRCLFGSHIVLWCVGLGFSLFFSLFRFIWTTEDLVFSGSHSDFTPLLSLSLYVMNCTPNTLLKLIFMFKSVFLFIFF